MKIQKKTLVQGKQTVLLAAVDANGPICKQQHDGFLWPMVVPMVITGYDP